jgi:protein-L-isoaspartate(D-aspartate) O-methyltransferase
MSDIVFHLLLSGAIVMTAFAGGCRAQGVSERGFAVLRERMVKAQVERRGVKDRRVLDAMEKVPRHRFVPDRYVDESYEDRPLPIGEGQTISQPYIVALMTEVLALDSTKKVLEIGTGSGYQAAVLAEICDSVYTVEIIEDLGKRAEKLLAELGCGNIAVRIGDGHKGWKEHSPFDAIIVTCAPSSVPEPLIEQLAENGRLVIPVDTLWGQDLILMEKTGGNLKKKSVLPVRFVPMVKEDGTEY